MRLNEGASGSMSFLVFCAAVTACPAHTSAHHVVELRGEISMTARRISILVEPNAHAFAILGADQKKSGGRECAEWLSQSINLHDRHGRRITVVPDVAGRKMRFCLTIESTSWPLSLRWTPRSAGRVLRGRISLSWEIGDAYGNVVLTSGGNVVCLDAPDSPPGPPHEPIITIDTTAGMRVSIRLPAALMRNALKFSKPSDNYLSPRFCKELNDNASDWFERMIRVRSDRTIPAAGDEKLGISIRGDTRRPTPPVNAWTTEIEWSKTWDTASRKQLVIEISQELLVLAAFEARVISKDGTVREGLLTPADPSVIITRHATGERMSIGRRSWSSVKTGDQNE